MSDTILSSDSIQESPFESIKNVAEDGSEFWYGRDLQEALNYSWEDFQIAVERALAACEKSGEETQDHFLDFPKMIPTGKGAMREIRDMFLSRFACYVIAMNGDPRKKPEIALAQTYFAVQTRKQELYEQQTEDQKRLCDRQMVRTNNKHLAAAATTSGVPSARMGIFQDAGYQALYGGLRLAQIKAKKDISPKEDLLDCAGRAELAANNFRITQTEQKLTTQQIKGEQEAIRTHQEVGREVRETIKRNGTTLPENLVAEPNIKVLKKKPENKQFVKDLESGKILPPTP